MASKPNVLVIPYPVQGHINPMLQFSKRLASKGLNVTLVATGTICKSLKQAQASSITLVTIPDGCENGPLGYDEYLKRFKIVVEQNLFELIERNNNCGTPFQALVYDSMMPWALEVAHRLGLKGASFFTQSCCVSALYFHFYEGTLKVPIDGDLVFVPSISISLEVHDLPSFIYDLDSNQSVGRAVVNQFSNFREADWLFFNSFDKLEDEVSKWMSTKWSIKTIGPTIPSQYTDKRLEDDKDYGLNLFNLSPNTSKKWLDTKKNGSVIYISFGSVANLGQDQMEELAYGLMSLNTPFLWVVRASEMSKLPTNFVSENLGKNLILHWCCQIETLAHRAIGCFITHCGWNSTLEALSLGVPMVAMPQWTDQTTNTKFIVDVWRIGVRVKVNEKGVATREEIKICVKDVMEGEKGNEIRKNSVKFMECAKEAVDEGGSSDNNIDEFVSSFCTTAI